MGGDKIMNPVLKMRKKQKEKEREKRREIKRNKKINEIREDELDSSYNPNSINELKDAGKSLDKTDKEHYQQRPLTWHDLDNNLKTGTINRGINDSYGYYSGIVDPNQNTGNLGYSANIGAQRNMYGLNPRSQPRWQGDSLTSQPMLYNQPPVPISTVLPDNAEPAKKVDTTKDKKKFMQDQFDPLNPHNAGKNFIHELYKKDQKEPELDQTNANEDVDKLKSELSEIKETAQDKKTNFVPSALRKRKAKAPVLLSSATERTPKPVLVCPAESDEADIVAPVIPLIGGLHKPEKQEKRKTIVSTTNELDSLLGMYE